MVLDEGSKVIFFAYFRWGMLLHDDRPPRMEFATSQFIGVLRICHNDILGDTVAKDFRVCVQYQT